MKPPRCEPRGFSFEIRAGAAQRRGHLQLQAADRRLEPSVALSREVLHQGEVREGGANGTRLTVDAVSLDSLLGMTGVRANGA